MKTLKGEEEARSVRGAGKAAREAEKELSFEKLRAQRRTERARMDRVSLSRRVASYGDTNVLPRALKL